MINIRDLRIGNYVMYNGLMMAVYSIIGAYPRREKRYDNKVVIDLFDGAGIITASLDEIKPIPITEKWLLKLGFEIEETDRRYTSYIHPETPGLEVDYQLKTFTLYIGDTRISRIWCVHQLQNIYFAITSEELYPKI